MKLPYTEVNSTSTNLELDGDEFMDGWVRTRDLKVLKGRKFKVALVNGAI